MEQLESRTDHNSLIWDKKRPSCLRKPVFLVSLWQASGAMIDIERACGTKNYSPNRVGCSSREYEVAKELCSITTCNTHQRGYLIGDLKSTILKQKVHKWGLSFREKCFLSMPTRSSGVMPDPPGIDISGTLWFGLKKRFLSVATLTDIVNSIYMRQ